MYGGGGDARGGDADEGMAPVDPTTTARPARPARPAHSVRFATDMDGTEDRDITMRGEPFHYAAPAPSAAPSLASITAAMPPSVMFVYNVQGSEPMLMGGAPHRL